MASPGKVVRIEDVEAQPSGDRVRFREDTFVFSQDGGRASKLRPDSLSQGLVSATASSKTDLSVSQADTNLTVQLQPDPPTASQDARDSAEEMADTVGPLPVGWPKIPALLRRRSCEMSKIMSPCVNKAVSHLELVQNIIDEWFRRAGDDIQSRLSSRQSKASRLSKNTPSRLMLKFGQDTSAVETEIEGNTLGVALSKPHTVSTRSSISSKTELSVLGVGGRLETESDDGDSVSEDGSEAPPAEADVPYLGAEDVIEEVTTLLARLEDDRQNTLNKLHSEEHRVENLHKQIEAISLKRLVELPQLVQQEHEACILDVNELQWHVAYSSRSLDRIQNKTNIADVLNQRLKEDIGFVDKHIPLVQEKLELELEAMDKIRQAQLETNKELELILTRQAKTESKSREAHDKAATERAHIERELNAARESLRQICDEYSTATTTFNSYTHQCNDIIQQLKDNQQEKLVLEVKNENAKHSEDMQAVKVRDLETLITEAEFEHRRLANENSQLQNDLDSKKTKHSSRIKEMHSQIQHKENELRQLTLKNKEVKMEIQDCQDKIARCEKQKEVDERNMTRIRKELVRTEQQMETTMEDFRKVFAINGALRSQLRTDEEKAFKFEENLKQTAETLKRQVKDEVHTRTVLTARIGSDSTDVSRTSEEAIQKKRKVSQVVDEVTTAVVQVEDKVTRLRSAKDSKAKKIAELRQKIEEVRNQQKDTDEGVEEQMKVFAPHHKHLKEDILSFDKKLDHIAWRSELMKKNMDDMESSSVMMGRVLEATEKQNKALDEELQELNVQLEAGQKVKNSLKASMQSVEERVHLLDRQQKQFISERKQHLQSLENNKMEALRMNKEMAGTYRQLQNDAVLLKNDLLDIYEERISMENSIKDLKQLRSLQLRMHGALVEYFKFRGLYNEAEVDKLESESSNNACRVTELQADMNKALSSITRFLQNELVGESNQPLLPTVTPPVKGKQLPRVGTVKS